MCFVKLPRGWRTITHENSVKRLWRVHFGPPPIREVLPKAEPLSRKRGDDERAVCDKTIQRGGRGTEADSGRPPLKVLE